MNVIQHTRKTSFFSFHASSVPTIQYLQQDRKHTPHINAFRSTFRNNRCYRKCAMYHPTRYCRATGVCQRISGYHPFTWTFSLQFLFVVSFKHHLDDFYLGKDEYRGTTQDFQETINRNLNRIDHFKRWKASRSDLAF